MWVQLLTTKKVDVQGKPATFQAGDWVNVGKQTAAEWFEAGQCTAEKLERERLLAFVEAQRGLRKEEAPVVRQPRVIAPVVLPETFTIFAVPMSFKRETVRTKQENALGSWKRLKPEPLVFLLGDEHGIAAAAQEFGCFHLPHIQRNSYKTPIVGDAFRQAQRLAAPEDVIVYVNADIILLQDWADAVMATAKRFEQFLMVGRRWDIDYKQPLDFGANWGGRLRQDVAERGKLHSVGALDYFAFRPGLYEEVPGFAIGRSAWDNWLVMHAIRSGVATVDASEAATIVHQDMPGPKVPRKGDRRLEWERNQELYRPARAECGIVGKATECGWMIDADGTFVERDAT